MRPIGPIKVLIVDDSALVRSILSRVLSEDKDIKVIGGAKDPFEARELIIEYRPDVIILDIEMPRMNGLTFLKKLMVHYPVPVIMCSGAVGTSRQAALQAIEDGAIEVVAKPTTGGAGALQRLGEELADKIRAAAVALPAPPPIPSPVKAAPISFRAAGLDPNEYLIAIGASTGGTEAIRQILSRFPPDCPPVAIVQHMPEGFTKAFADRLNRFSPLSVNEAVDEDKLEPGKALLARGGIQMRIKGGIRPWRINYGDDEPVNRHCPSVDVLFNSVARRAGKQAVGILLTGMGEDGAKGLLNMRQNGAITIAQDKQSCVVYGMPKVAVVIGAVQYQVPLVEIPRITIQALRSRDASRSAAAASK